MSTRTAGAILGLLLLAATAAGAEEPTVEPPACLPTEANAVVRARVPAAVDLPAGGVRLYFRRLNPVGAFYHLEMRPSGGGAYWSALPRPTAAGQQPLTDDWWEVLKTRDWMRAEGRDRAWLEDWLADQEREAAEVYAAVYDAAGALVERSDVALVPVRDEANCRPPLDDRERGQAENLWVGETTELQVGRELFHWLCQGVVTRISPEGIARPDEICRACIIGSGPPGTGVRAASAK